MTHSDTCRYGKKDECEGNPVFEAKSLRYIDTRKAFSKVGQMQKLDFSSAIDGNRDEIINLFELAFAASEGVEEGALIGKLAKDLLDTTPDRDLYTFTARNNAEMVGVICFSRFRFEHDNRVAFMLSPVAVRPSAQRQGIGQALLGYGLNFLRERKIDLAITYGDPKYYRQVGFEQITEKTIPSPHALSQPEGWMA